MVAFLLSLIGVKAKASPLSGLIHLPKGVQVFVPSTMGVNGESDGRQQLWVQRLVVSFDEWFGGATCTVGTGTWVSDTVGVVHEDIIIVDARCRADDLDRYLDRVVRIAHDIRIDMGQEAVTIMVNGEMYLV